MKECHVANKRDKKNNPKHRFRRQADQIQNIDLDQGFHSIMKLYKMSIFFMLNRYYRMGCFGIRETVVKDPSELQVRCKAAWHAAIAVSAVASERHPDVNDFIEKLMILKEEFSKLEGEDALRVADENAINLREFPKDDPDEDNIDDYFHNISIGIEEMIYLAQTLAGVHPNES